jgi:hypothetical protein
VSLEEGPSRLARLAATIGAAVGQRAEHAGMLLRRELYRAASILALLLFAWVCACGAIGFAAVAVLAALGEAHRALGASLVAAGLALAAVAAAYRARVIVAPPRAKRTSRS